MNAVPGGNIWVFYLAARAAIDDGDLLVEADGPVLDEFFGHRVTDEDRRQQSDAAGRHEGRARRGAQVQRRDKVLFRGSMC